MNKNEVLGQLRSMGTAQNRKVYSRHGVQGDQYGVSYGNLAKLKKAIKVDQVLAEQLWKTANHDARVLATMIADPTQMRAGELKVWVKELTSYVLTDAFSGLASRSPVAKECMEKWVTSKAEWVGSAGWNVLSHLAMTDDQLSNTYLERYLKTIEKKIRTRKNRVKYAMNNALIAIGIRNPELEKKATAAAKRIGKVEVDHGQTGCKTPDAVSYIRRAVERKAKKRQARSPKK